jgi:hypothetical protein
MWSPYSVPLKRIHATTRAGALLRAAAVLGASIVVAGLFVVPAFSGTGLNWNETARNGKVPVLSFGVTSLTIGKTGWSARVSFGNLSTKTIRVGDQFGVAFFTDSKTTNPAYAAALAFATSFSPARPVSLKPGATWSGLIGGIGQLSASRPSLYARIVFGPLTGVSGQASAIYWITDHSMTLAPAGMGGVTPTAPATIA